MYLFCVLGVYDFGRTMCDTHCHCDKKAAPRIRKFPNLGGSRTNQIVGLSLKGQPRNRPPTSRNSRICKPTPTLHGQGLTKAAVAFRSMDLGFCATSTTFRLGFGRCGTHVFLALRSCAENNRNAQIYKQLKRTQLACWISPTTRNSAVLYV